MAALHRNRQASFTQLRDGLGLTDGNLASHAARLEGAGYVTSGRVLRGRRGFELRYRITPEGVHAFQQYVDALATLLGNAGFGKEGDESGAVVPHDVPAEPSDA